MFPRLFSQMSKEELRQEAERLKAEMKKKADEGRISEAQILEKRYYLCLSYLRDPREIQPGQTYAVEGEGKHLTVEYLNGVMAWGKIRGDEGGELVAYPIGQLILEERTENG